SSGAKIILHANDIFYLTGEHKGELESFKALVSRAHEKGIFVEGVIDAFAFIGKDVGDEKTVDEMCFHKKDGSRIFFQTEGGKIYIGNLYSLKYRQFLLEQAKKLIDCDVDAIYVGNVLTALGTSAGPPGVGNSKEAGEVTKENLNPSAWKELADSIRQYSVGKGKFAGVSTLWWEGEPAPFVDYQTSFYQIDADWKKLKDNSKKLLGKDVPFVVTLDSGTAMIFLNKLKDWDAARREDFFTMVLADCRENKVTFAFPYRVIPFVDSVKDKYFDSYKKVVSAEILPRSEALLTLYNNFKSELAIGAQGGGPPPGVAASQGEPSFQGPPAVGVPPLGQGGGTSGSMPPGAEGFLNAGAEKLLDILINMKPALSQAQWLKIAKIGRAFLSKGDNKRNEFLSNVRMVLTEPQGKIFDSKIRSEKK
ncbi:MAG: hypothetical protein M1536_01640, partial [Firmicutes bacterium]|nr:hypothetical protein [Bacillota bacterium]